MRTGTETLTLPRPDSGDARPLGREEVLLEPGARTEELFPPRVVPPMGPPPDFD